MVQSRWVTPRIHTSNTEPLKQQTNLLHPNRHLTELRWTEQCDWAWHKSLILVHFGKNTTIDCPTENGQPVNLLRRMKYSPSVSRQLDYYLPVSTSDMVYSILILTTLLVLPSEVVFVALSDFIPLLLCTCSEDGRSPTPKNASLFCSLLVEEPTL